MKSFKSLGIAAIFLSLSLFIISCGNSDHSHDGEAEHTHAHDDNDEGHGHDHDDGHGHDHDEEGHSHGEAAVHGEGTAYTAAYVCPMHCQDSGSTTEGKCPTCNMDYIAQAEHAKDGHSH